jgi:hypothetical protein
MDINMCELDKIVTTPTKKQMEYHRQKALEALAQVGDVFIPPKCRGRCNCQLLVIEKDFHSWTIKTIEINAKSCQIHDNDSERYFTLNFIKRKEVWI